VTADVLGAIPDLLESARRLAVATIVSAKGSTPRTAGARMLVLPDGSTRSTVGGGLFEDRVRLEALDLLSRGGPPRLVDYPFTPDGPGSFGAVCGGTVKIFFEVVESQPRLLVVGAGHCGRALAAAAALAGYQLTVADDRADLLSADAFPVGTRLVSVSADFRELPAPGAGDSVAIVSRGHATDGLALRRMRSAPAAYLGMMGSRSKKKVLFDQLRSEGWSEDELARVACPIGLDIGAETPEEIAVSILAEMIRLKRSGTPTTT
jgi:xanthine dehydrogenase accessory factor